MKSYLKSIYYTVQNNRCPFRNMEYGIISNVIAIYSLYYFKFLSIAQIYLPFEIDHSLSMYVTRGIEGGHPKCAQMHTGGEEYNVSCVRTHLYYLFLCFYLMLLCFICRNLTLSSFKKGGLVRNEFFF